MIRPAKEADTEALIGFKNRNPNRDSVVAQHWFRNAKQKPKQVDSPHLAGCQPDR